MISRKKNVGYTLLMPLPEMFQQCFLAVLLIVFSTTYSQIYFHLVMMTNMQYNLNYLRKSHLQNEY